MFGKRSALGCIAIETEALSSTRNGNFIPCGPAKLPLTLQHARVAARSRPATVWQPHGGNPNWHVLRPMVPSQNTDSQEIRI